MLTITTHGTLTRVTDMAGNDWLFQDGEALAFIQAYYAYDVRAIIYNREREA